MEQSYKKMSNSFKRSFFLTGALPHKDVKILQRGYGSIARWNYPLQSSSFWYLWRNRTKGARVICNGRSYPLDPDHYILVPPFTAFSTECSALPMIQFHLHFTTGSLLRSVKRDIHVIDASSVDHMDTEEFFKGLERRAEQRDLLHVYLFSLIYSLLDHLMQEKDYRLEEENMHKVTLAFLDRVTFRLRRKHLYEEFCREYPVSQPTVLRLFKKDIGMTPEQYLISCRLAEAKNLLQQTTLSLKEIAELTGFSDRYHLSKIFRKYEHIPPATYRKNPFLLTEDAKK